MADGSGAYLNGLGKKAVTSYQKAFDLLANHKPEVCSSVFLNRGLGLKLCNNKTYICNSKIKIKISRFTTPCW